MKYSAKLILILIASFFVSCNNKQINNKTIFNGEVLKNLIEKSLQDDIKSSNRLDGLFTFISPNFSSYSKIFIDSISINNKNYYSVLIQNENPIYNLFAIINNKMDLLLKDESLNGYLSSSWKKFGSKIFVIVNEDFTSKDIVHLKRVSYYRVDSLAGNLVFRQFTEIKSPTIEANQNITSISDSVISTQITKKNSSASPRDIFRFDIIKNKYLSASNKFDELVKSDIENIKTSPNGLQITDVESIKSLLGLESDSTANDSSPIVTVNEFDIKLDNQWRKLGNYTILSPLKKEVKGVKFINPKIGAEVSIFKLSPNDSTESYFDLVPLNFDKADKIRTTDEFTDAKSIYRINEYTCPTKKIILILKAPKISFDDYRDVYNNIIKSFRVHC